ncbi:MAG: hypothetical protein CMJ40_08490 [Phycisphaerae bacterium]|nr:hypothetical protein [Phycisphaerae bacterium]
MQGLPTFLMCETSVRLKAEQILVWRATLKRTPRNLTWPVSRLVASAMITTVWSIGCVGVPVQAADHLLCLSDLGSPSSPAPDGFADRIIWDDVQQRLIVEYLGPDGLDRNDRSGQIIDIHIADGGIGYGRGSLADSGMTVCDIPVSRLSDDFRVELLGESFEDDPANPMKVGMWTLPLNVEGASTEGHGFTASAVLDGRAGVWSYYPVDHPWQNPLIDLQQHGLSSADQDLQIVHPGSGYAIPSSLTGATQSRLVVRIFGEGIGSLGFIPGGDLTSSRYSPLAANVIEDTVTEMEITGDVLNPFAYRPGNWRNFLAHTPATGNMESGWSLPWAADTPGQIANLLIEADAMGVEHSGEFERLSDKSLQNNQGEVRHDQEIESLSLIEDVSTQDDDADVDESETYSTEPTSGSGYKSGYFQIRDVNGLRVNGWKIRYETDAKGGIYVNAKGSAIPMAGNMTQERVGVNGAETYQYGWVLEDNPAMAEDASGWTLHPVGNGRGFSCTGIQLFGSLIALPPISNRNDSNEGYDVTSAPSFEIKRASGSGPVKLAKTEPILEAREPAQGRIVGSIIHQSGSGYYRLPSIELPENATGSGARLTPVPGDDGRRIIGGDVLEFANDLSNWNVYGDGDFNSDGHADLLLHDPDAGDSYLINLGPDAAVLAQKGQLQATALPSLNTSWAIGGIGKMGLSGPGCCVLWRNELTGQNAVWIVDSSSSDSTDWIRPESAFLPTVMDLGWSMSCTNNAARNQGDRVYWIDPEEGSLAQWKLSIKPDSPSSDWLSDPDYLRDSQGDRIIGLKSSWEIVGAGSLAGHPKSDGSNAFRDLLLFDRDSGRSAIWLMDGSGSQIDGSAPNGGAGFVTQDGSIISGDIRYCRPVGIGHYAQQDVYWTSTDTRATRTQWFPTIGWSLPGGGPWFTWQLDRDIDRLRMEGSSLEGSGKSSRPFRVDSLR